MRKTIKNRRGGGKTLSFLLAVSAMLAMAAAKAADQYWAGSDVNGFGLWNGATSWAAAAGEEGSAAWTAGNTAYFTNSAPTVIDLGGSTVFLGTIRTPDATAEAPASILLTNGTVNLSAATNNRYAEDSVYLANATLTLGEGCTMHNTNTKYGSIAFNRASHLVVGNGASFIEDSNGVNNQNEASGPNFIGVNYSNSNSLTVCEGGSVSLKRHLVVGGAYGPKGGGNANAIGTLDIRGGTLTSAGTLFMGSNVSGNNAHNNNGKGYYIQNGGEVRFAHFAAGSQWHKSYQSYNSRVSFTLNAGSFTCGNFIMYYMPGNVTVTINGGTLQTTGVFRLGYTEAGTQYVRGGKVYLNGGVWKVGGALYINDQASSASTYGGIWCNGGTIQPTASVNTTDGAATRYFVVNEGGLKINTASGITFGLYQQVTGGTGALTKQGAGTVNVKRQLLSTGGVAVSAGTLNFTASGNILSGGPLVMTGGTFNCTNATLASRVEVSPGARIASSGTLTFNSNTSLKLGFNTSSNNSSAFSDQQKIKAAGISVGSGIIVPITFETGTSFPLGDTYVLIKDANLSNANKFAVTSATANGVDITDCVYLDVESGNLVLKRKPYFTIKVR